MLDQCFCYVVNIWKKEKIILHILGFELAEKVIHLELESRADGLVFLKFLKGEYPNIFLVP